MPARSEAAESSWRYPSLHLLQPSHQSQSLPVQRSPRTVLCLLPAPPSDQRTPAKTNTGNGWNSTGLYQFCNVYTTCIACIFYMQPQICSLQPEDTVWDTISHNAMPLGCIQVMLERSYLCIWMHISQWVGGGSVRKHVGCRAVAIRRFQSTSFCSRRLTDKIPEVTHFTDENS